jgi:TRAP-type C4-dicarboxylate transport system substrate-binding protein
MELPTIFDSAETGARIAWTLFQEGLVAPDYQGFKVLSLFTAAPFGILVIDRNVSGLRDLRGMRIRVSGATIGLAFARLGMIPLGLPSNLLGTALAKDWLDAIFFSLDSARATVSTPPRKVTDETPVLIDANFAAPAQIAVMNQKSFDALPPDLQAVIDRLTGAAFAIKAGRVRDEGEAIAKRALVADPKHRVFSFSDQDQLEITARIAPVFDDWIADMKTLGIDGAALLKRARALSPASS